MSLLTSCILVHVRKARKAISLVNAAICCKIRREKGDFK